MRSLNWIVLVPMAVLAGACGRSSSPALDDALKTDLSLASQAQPATVQPISPTEAGYAAQQQLASSAPRPAARRVSAPAPARRTSTARRSSSSGASGASSGSGGYYPAPAPAPLPPPVVVKHGQRDAAIGAAAGAVLGATTSRNKMKGGIIGAAVGGILGGVIGNNVDKQTQTP
jgi:hypothetical protein